MSVTHVCYFVPIDGDVEEQPNVFAVRKPQKLLTLGDIMAAFPLPGSYIFRAKAAYGKTYVWFDLQNADDPVPAFNGRTLLKVSRISAVSGGSASSVANSSSTQSAAPASAPAVAPVARAPAPAPVARSAAPAPATAPVQARAAAAPAPAPPAAGGSTTADVLGLFDDSGPAAQDPVQSARAPAPTVSGLDFFTAPAPAAPGADAFWAGGGMGNARTSAPTSAPAPAGPVGRGQPLRGGPAAAPAPAPAKKLLDSADVFSL